MPLSWNEIRDRAIQFSREWEGETSEDAEAKSFWDGFFNVFGIGRRRVASFEVPTRKTDGQGGFVDLLWKGTLLVEHKSRGKDLDRAFKQATDYFPGIRERDLPRYIVVSDFERMRLYDLDTDEQIEFSLGQLHRFVRHFGFIAGYSAQHIAPQDPVNVRAAENMGRVHDMLKSAGYIGHPLEVLLVRLVFCLFADDTGIFPKGAFREWIDQRTSEDGSDLGPGLALLFQVLNTPEGNRQTTLDAHLASFPYVNGRLFEESLPLSSFDTGIRTRLLECCALDWGNVSPAIFGALFQSIMDEDARRELGAHYTSEENILKLIRPLFLDELEAEFARVQSNKPRLLEFHNKLRALTFLDPACGCGNFLVITYRELRRLELEVLRAVHKGPGSKFLDIHQEILVDVDQFYGIEIEEFPAQIAQVSLWLVDHQMNLKVSEEFGQYYARIPLRTAPHIQNANALEIDWATVLPPDRASYVLGNPPFVGSKFMTFDQRVDMSRVAQAFPERGVLDYVTAWYLRAEAYIGTHNVSCAFVSTNSITQGEQVPALWPLLLQLGLRIHFAHRTFQWRNEARGRAAVHCVIIGFARRESEQRTLYEYDDVRGQPHPVRANNISPYLIDAPNIIVQGRTRPLSASTPIIQNGSIPADGGGLILTIDEANELIGRDARVAEWLRPYVGAEGLIDGQYRRCLWLGDCPPEQLRSMPEVMTRLDAVRAFRMASTKEATREKAAIPMRFTEDRQPRQGTYLAIPRTSSEARRYLPLGFLDSSVIAANDLQIVPGATPFHFGVLSSSMHMAWARITSGRLKSDLRYSVRLTYNTFPWPVDISDLHTSRIVETANEVIAARNASAGATLADLYDVLSMPAALVKAHQRLDAAVEAAYLGRKRFGTESERLVFLLEQYAAQVAPMTAVPPRARRRSEPAA